MNLSPLIQCMIYDLLVSEFFSSLVNFEKMYFIPFPSSFLFVGERDEETRIGNIPEGRDRRRIESHGFKKDKKKSSERKG